MKGLLKNCWYNNILTFFILCGSYHPIAAQNSFFIKIPVFSAENPDILEDEKGCILAQFDYSITRINHNGRILWQTDDIGLLQGACIRDSNAYVYFGLLTEFGGMTVQSFDYRGNKKWCKKEAFTNTAPMRTVNDFLIDSSRKQYIVAGSFVRVGDNDNFKYWIAGLDYSGNIIWENYWRDIGLSRYFSRVLKNNKSGGYTLITVNELIHESQEIFNVDSMGNLTGRNFIRPKTCDGDQLTGTNLDRNNIINYGDGFLGVVLKSYTSSCKCIDREYGAYFYFYDYQGTLVDKKLMTWENGIDNMITLPNSDILGIYGDTSGNLGITIVDTKLNTKWKKMMFNDLPDNEYLLDFKVKKSRDGGYLGIAGARTFSDGDYVYVFKTDSLGNINPAQEFSEKQQSVMLQPNPAINKVRITIPYYFGKVSVRFYNMQGVFLFEKTKDEQDIYDISGLSSGMYIVKARLEETGEMRTMKLIVQ